MGASCTFKPQAKGTNQNSKLFDDLLKFTGNRETAVDIYSMAVSSEFISTLDGIKKDELGEPTLESLDKVLNLRQALKDGISVESALKELKATKDGKPVLYDSVDEVYNKVTEFNDNNPKLVADIVSEDGKFKITVEPKTVENESVPKELVFNNSLNNRLLSMLRAAGFDVDVVERSRFNAIFSPQRATTNAQGLRTIIQIVKGELGEEAFPEEFCHVAIEGLMNNPLVSRLVKSLNSIDILKEILGDEFQRYVTLYKGDMATLQKEAAGKLLSQSLKKENLAVEREGLLDRIVNFIKSLFNNLTGNMIDDALSQATKDADMIAKNILKDNLFDSIDKESILNAGTLYSTERELKGMEKFAENALELASRRYNILRTKRRGKYNAEEYNKLNYLKKLIEQKKYAMSCEVFLEDCFNEIKILNEKIKELKNSSIKNEEDLIKLKQASNTLINIKDFINAYNPIVQQMKQMDSYVEDGEVELEEKDMKAIINMATNIDSLIGKINKNYDNLRYDTVYAFLKMYWGEDKLIDVGKEKGGTITLDMLMLAANKDIGIIDRYISSMSDASDPMLSLIDKIVKTTQNKRDAKLEEILANVRAEHAKLEKAGHTTDFMYEKDENGVPTGRIISDIDFIKFQREKEAEYEKLKALDLEYSDFKSRMDRWVRTHTEAVIINDEGRTDVLPKKALYAKPENKRLANTLTTAQKEYYNFMMQLKSIMDGLLPEQYVDTYRAIQIRKDTTEAILSSISDPKRASKILKNRLKDNFIRRTDDTDFGQQLELDGAKTIELDYSGNPIKRLPVYFTAYLEDMNMLSTDFTSSIISYASMAINYEEMSRVVDALELTRDFVKEREVKQYSGDQKMVEVVQALGSVFKKDYVKKGEKTGIGDRIDSYYENAIYEQRKLDEGTINFFGKQIDKAKVADFIKSYSGAVGLGLNLFSGISNVTMGKLQMFLESVGKEYYTPGDSLKGMKQYWAMLPQYMGELNAVNKKSKLSLMIDKFDALEEFYSNLRQKGYYNGVLSRVIGSSNIYFLNNMGEHYLHTRNMLAMLNATKVKNYSGSEVSLYSALKVVENDGVSELVLEKGTTDLDGRLISTEGLEYGSAEYEEVKTRFDSYVSNQKNRIGKVNQALNGAFNENDKGEIQRHSLGRLAMQFRQWMPAHLGRRFAGTHYDARLDQMREGYYRTFGRFILDTMKDAKKMQFNIATRLHELSPHEKANIRKATAELTIFAALSMLIAAMGPDSDRKDKWGERMLSYQLKRLQLETGASVPYFTIFENMFQILQSPSASINNIENFVDLLNISNMFVEIQSGKYKGYTKWERAFVKAMPIYSQVQKVGDIKNEDYMFAIFKMK